jgi:hypothetical protein
MFKSDLPRRCPRGHLADGAPCVYYKCERRAPAPVLVPRAVQLPPLEQPPLSLRLDKIDVIHWDGPLCGDYPPKGQR